MRSSKSSSCSKASSSYLLTSKIMNKRLETIFKKAYELSTLCDIEVCVIYYGPDGELKTWPKEKEKVRDMALRYSLLDQAKRRKKSIDLYGFLMKNKNKTTTTNIHKKLKKTILKKNVNELKYPISDHYSPDQIPQVIQSLELAYSTLQERLRFVEAKKHKEEETVLDHQSLLPSSSLNNHHQNQNQSLNSSKFSLFMFNHKDATFSQIPIPVSTLSADYSTVQDSGLKHQELYGCDQNNNFQHLQDYSALQGVQESYLKNQLVMKEMYGYDQNMCMGDINNNSFQGSCASNTEDYSALPAVQELVNNYELNQLKQLTQHELHGYGQDMRMSDITNSNSNTASNEFWSDFQDVSTSYDVHFGQSSLFDTSTLPSLHTIPNSYFLSDNSRCL